MFLCGLGPKNEERQSKTKRKMAQVKERGGGGVRVRGFSFFFLTLVSFLARSKPKVPFLGLSLLRNQTETLATQARHDGDRLKPKAKRLRQIIPLICSVHVGLVVHSCWE